MRILVRSLVLCVALGGMANGAVVGAGDAIAIAGGNGVDLLVWRDAYVVKAIRFNSAGMPLDGAAITFPLSPAGPPSATWDGGGFVVTWPYDGFAIARIALNSGTSFAMRVPTAWPVFATTVASLRNGSSVVAWGEGVSTGQDYNAVAVSSTGEVALMEEDLVVPDPGFPHPKLVADEHSYLLGLVNACRGEPCGTQTRLLLRRLDANATPIASTAALTFPYGGLAEWSFSAGGRPLLAFSTETALSETTLLSFDPGQYRAARRSIRFPESLTTQEIPGRNVLVGAGARIDLSDTGAPLTANWAPVPDGQRLVGVLPSSGARVLAPASGAGSISVEAPVGDVSEVGLAPVFVSPASVWLKVDNRGPDAVRTIDVWVTGAVQSISSLVNGTITRHGALSRVRFHPTLKQGAGFEIAIWFEQPIDANAFEAWALTLGTDRDATNNYVTTRAPEPEPEIPRRRRMVWR